MRSLLLPDSLKILESLTFTRTLYAFDFDGTLSKIVRHPADASLTPKTIRLLKTLTHLVPVAIISGRSLPDLKSRLACTPQYLIGNHGLEGLSSPSSSMEIAKRMCQKWRHELASAITGKESFSGVELEDKIFSIAVHYRGSRSKRDAKLSILETLSYLTPPPRLIMGKSVINILPPGAPHKGVALMELMSEAEFKSAFYIGDDDTDEDVFALPDSRIMTVRVGRNNHSRAQYFLHKQSDVNKVLRLLIDYRQPEEAR